VVVVYLQKYFNHPRLVFANPPLLKEKEGVNTLLCIPFFLIRAHKYIIPNFLPLKAKIPVQNNFNYMLHNI